MKRCLTILAIAALLVGAAAALAKEPPQKPLVPYPALVRAAEAEPNDDCGTANPLALGDPMSAAIGVAGDVDWFEFEQLPQLAFDHAEIIEKAHQRLVAKLDYSSIAFQFLNPTFSLSELQGVYETLLNQSLDKRNFRKRILSLDLIEETGKLRRNGKHRPAREYRVKHPERVEIIK
mgnify:CR=1 FL=1